MNPRPAAGAASGSAVERARSLFLTGVARFERGAYAEAAESFEASLAVFAGRASTLVNLGASRIKLGQADAALESLDAALVAEPERSDAWCQRGLACAALGRDVEALDCFDRAFVLGERSAALHLERTLVLNRLRRHQEALASVQVLLELQPRIGQVHLLHGETLQHLGRHEEAFEAYERALKLEPGLGPAWSRRGHVLRLAGRLADAAASYLRALEAGDNPPMTRYYLGATGAGPAPATPPVAYVRELFDDYADRFDEELVQRLHYRGHVAVVEPLAALGCGPFHGALDLGCGTGLAAPLLRPMLQRLVGIDLSPGMLQRAARLGLYDQLIEAEAIEHLRSTAQRYELIVCCDVLIYVGDLAPLFAGVQRVLQPGGVFGFSVECIEADQGFALRPSLRYGHSEAYLRGLAAAHGLQALRVGRGALREDRGAPIEGLFMHLRRV